jgi:hypothetical protein
MEMRGVLHRLTDDLLYTAGELDGNETRVKVFVRYGLISREMLQLSNSIPFTRVESAHDLVEDMFHWMLGDTHFKSRVFKIEFRIEKKVQRE